METLKSAFIIVFSFLAFTINAQSAGRQSAFTKSYEYENASNYASAIKEVKTVFDGDDYFCNIRLGWLYYLTKKLKRVLENVEAISSNSHEYVQMG